MIVESHKARRLVGRLDAGVDILEGLERVCRSAGVRAGEIRAIGTIDSVTVGDQRRFATPFTILQLYGTVAERDGRLLVRAAATLSRERDNGIEVIGGALQAGRVLELEFVIDAFDDLGAPRQEPVAAAPPAPKPPAPKPAEPPPAPSPPKVGWAEVIAASEKAAVAPPAPAVEAPIPEPVSAPTDQDDSAKVAPGDFIDHPKFGRVTVERIVGDHEFVSARLRNQRLINLSLEVLRLVLVGREGARQLFRAETAAR